MLMILYSLRNHHQPIPIMTSVKTMTSMKAWMRASTSAEKDALAERSGTSVAYLHHLAAGEETNYRREAKPTLAAAIERETKVMARASKGRLPVVYRTDLNSACRGCDFARRCLGDDVVVRGSFPIAVEVEAGDTEGGSAD